MIDIRELLREATADLPVRTGDPVERIRRGVARRRRGQAAVVTVVVAVVAAIAVPLAVTRSPRQIVPTVPPHPTTTTVGRWDPSADDAAYGYGAIWAVKCCSQVIGRSWVDELDPSTGRRLDRITVPTPASRIAVGADYVWVIGQNPGGGGPSAITAINPATLHTITMHITDRYAEPYNIAFADGAAWVTVELENAVWRLTANATSGTIAKSVVSVPGGPNQIATTRDGQLWVEAVSGHQLVRIDPTSEQVVSAATWAGDIYAEAPGAAGALWATAADGGHDVVALTPDMLQHCLACAQDTPLHVAGETEDVTSTSSGVYVWVTVGNESYTLFWSYLALNGSRAEPTASLPYGGALSPDPQNDGVVIGTSEGLIHWDPTG